MTIYQHQSVLRLILEGLGVFEPPRRFQRMEEFF